MIKNIVTSVITTAIVIGALLVSFDAFVVPQNPNTNEKQKIAGTTENGPKTEFVNQENSSVISTAFVVGIAVPKSYGNKITTVIDNTWSVGSGCILDSKGYIITNQHVIGKAKEDIYVTLYGGDVVKGKAVWSNQELDLAVIKIPVAGLPVAKMGDSETLRIGEKAIAIGNPLGFDFQGTLTAGVISGLNRSIEVEGTYMEDLIQTDASINSGNSGGPLLNGNGEIIGVNTIKVTSAEGIGFAIPINLVKPIIKSFIENGKFNEPYLGIEGYDRAMLSNISSQIRLKSGVYVDSVNRNSPAEKAGIKDGDIIVGIDDVEISTLCRMRQVLYGVGANKKINMRILSGEEDKIISVLLTEKN